MSTEKSHDIFSERQSLRCHPRTRRALKRVVNRLSDDRLKFRDDDATQEAIVSAIWWAMEDMTSDDAGLEEAARWLSPYLRRIEGLGPESGRDRDAEERPSPPRVRAAGREGRAAEDHAPKRRVKGA